MLSINRPSYIRGLREKSTYCFELKEIRTIIAIMRLKRLCSLGKIKVTQNNGLKCKWQTFGVNTSTENVK